MKDEKPLEPLGEGPLAAEPVWDIEAERAFLKAQDEKARMLGAKYMGSLGLEWTYD